MNLFRKVFYTVRSRNIAVCAVLTLATTFLCIFTWKFFLANSTTELDSIEITPLPSDVTPSVESTVTPPDSSTSQSSTGQGEGSLRDPIPVSPERFSPLHPAVDEIENALSELQGMNPNEILEFPMEEDAKFRLIGYQSNEGKVFGWNVLEVENFLKDSLDRSGKYPDDSKIILVVRDQSTQQRIIADPISKNDLLGRFVRSLSVMR